MEGLMQPDRLRARILLWAEEEIRLDKLPPKSGAVLEAAALSRRTPARRCRRDRRHRRTPGPPRRLRPDRPRRAHLRKHARPPASRLPRHPRLALDAGTVPGQDGVMSGSDLRRDSHINRTK